MTSSTYPRVSTVYGPVKSWRYGRSLGVDPIVVDSICSFNCVYCQLGEIHQVVDEQRLFVPTQQVINDLSTINMDEVDIITFSGSGEPTLALNIGEVINYIQAHYNKPVLVLTNSTWLHDAATRKRLVNASIIECKLDAADEEVYQRINRPAAGVSLARIIDGIKCMRAEPHFRGRITLQCMLLTANPDQVERLADVITDIKPAEVQINTPLRPKPAEWYIEARGNHGKDSPVQTHSLKTISAEAARAAAARISEVSGVPVRTVYDRESIGANNA